MIAPSIVWNFGTVKAGSDDVPFEVGGNTQEEAGILQGDSLGVTKPGINRHGGHVRLHERFYFFPDVSSGIHISLRPLPEDRIISCLNLLIISKSGPSYKGFLKIHTDSFIYMYNQKRNE